MAGLHCREVPQRRFPHANNLFSRMAAEDEKPSASHSSRYVRRRSRDPFSRVVFGIARVAGRLLTRLYLFGTWGEAGRCGEINNV